MTFTPQFRCINVISPRWGADISLFAIKDDIIDFEKSNRTQDIFALARKISTALNQPLGIKTLHIDDFGELNYINELNATELLEYADFEPEHEYQIEGNNLLDTSNQTKNDLEIIPESTLQEHIEWLSTSDEIPAMAIWPNYLIENELSNRGYSMCEDNTKSIANHIHSLIGYDDDHRDFILNMAFDRAINEGSLID